MALSYASAPPPTDVPNQVLDHLGLIKSQGVKVEELILTGGRQITSAQLLALKTTPLQLVPAPGAGLAIIVHSISLKINFGTVAYTLNAGTLKLFLGTTANAVALTGDLSALLTQTSSKENLGVPALATGVQTVANTENQGLFLGNDGAANYTLGDGTLDIVLQYQIVQM
jgi:hypothetical protein